jgi:uncharacterized membrane protein
VTTSHNSQDTQGQTNQDSVWTYRGYRLGEGQFATALAHFYRGEVQRSNVWRTRLDATTNWAVITAAAALTFTFNNPESPHYVILLVISLTLVFLGIEARRYRYYELWAHRVRLMETDFYAGMLVPPFAPSEEWAATLADSLLHPEFTISSWEAIGRRFRRNYVWVFALLGVSWWMKMFVHPTPTASLAEAVGRAAVGPLSGPVVVGIGIGFYALLMLMGIVTASMQESTAEILSTPSAFWSRWLPGRRRDIPSEVRPKWARTGRRTRQQLVLIITKESSAIAERIMRDVRRGVTKLVGQGMYTGESRDLLLCAVAPHQVLEVKAIVRALDRNAFVIVNPAEEVMGAGFEPL